MKANQGPRRTATSCLNSQSMNCFEQLSKSPGIQKCEKKRSRLVRHGVYACWCQTFCVAFNHQGIFVCLLLWWDWGGAAMRRTLCLGAWSRSWRWATALARPMRTSPRPFSASGRPRTWRREWRTKVQPQLPWLPLKNYDKYVKSLQSLTFLIVLKWFRVIPWIGIPCIEYCV